MLSPVESRGNIGQSVHLTGKRVTVSGLTVGGARDTSCMRKLRPHIDDILADHMAQQLGGKTGLPRRRIETAERQLRQCLESDGPRILTDGDKALLEIERQFAPAGAFARTMHADDLIFALTIYVHEPWLLDDRVDRAVQLRFADSLTGLIVGRRLIDRQQYACPLIDLRGGIDAAKAALSGERRAARRPG